MTLACRNGGKISVKNAFYGVWKGGDDKCYYTKDDCIDTNSRTEKNETFVQIYVVAKVFELEPSFFRRFES